MRLIVSLVVVLPLLAAGCTWVEPDTAGKQVQVAYGKNLGSCTSKGDITVSVKYKVGVYRRNDLKVRDELESLARNEAARIGADTIQATDEPLNGEQRFGAYSCR
ncbi:MAG: DUF4156 domain-containing protein [Rhodanobacteraceae bacterium]|nr:DUF4156 domain-containing protein [Rhodanobacteraceae bacterium]MBK7043121.1 DUF4156 domain-containing protein [Rhodanobacteraceae bacterium]MBP9154198.1 DUF4156 domain-containing protein [Xanthomonadales bacterium]HQW81651.1 DUF4156 domain-containing protein [Pseudomonadota bacterium]